MQLKEFYESVLPEGGRYVLFQNKRNDFFATMDDLVAATERRIDSQGLYFATAAYGDKFKVDDEGRKIPVRTQDNVVLLKAFRIDIDAGEEKFAKHPQDAYPTQRDAIAAFVAWVKATGLMPTLIVSSGEGLHIYWCLDQPVDPLAWHAVAVKLNAAGRAAGVKIDATCTSDTARVLRPVGTLHKNGKRVEVLRNSGKVWDFEEFATLVDEHAPEVEELPMRPSTPRAKSINDDVLDVQGPPASLAKIADYCSAVALMRDEEGCVPEPHWRAVLGLAKYCEDGEAVAHEWSSGYEGYSRRETQEKIDRWETPPTTCAFFSEMHEGCKTCKYRGQITTPKQLGYLTVAPAEPKPVEVEPPKAEGSFSLPDETPAEPTVDCPVPDRPDLFEQDRPFFWKINGEKWTLYHRVTVAQKDKTDQVVFVEKVIPVCNRLFWVDAASLPGATDTDGVMIQFGKVAHPRTSRQTRMSMPASYSADIRLLVKFLSDQGVNIESTRNNKDSHKHVSQYVVEEITRKQNDMRFVLKERFGYHFHEDQFLCSMGRYTVYPDGRIVNTSCNPKLNAASQSLTTTVLDNNRAGQWGAEVWKDVGVHASHYISALRKHYGRPGFEKARLALAINLSSPFLMFAADSVFRDDEDLPAIGFLVSMYSERSGIGKSSLMQWVAAAYGKNALARKGDKNSITPTAAATLAMNCAIYPMLLDEVTQNDSKQAAQLVDTFSNGLGRNRAIADGSVRKGASSWALVTTVATNIPQRELLSSAQKNSDALQMRVLELNFDDMPNDGDREAFAADLKRVQDKCGAFGLFQALQAVRTGCDKLTAMTAANVTEAYKLLGVDQQFRFFARMLGAMLTTWQLLGKHAPFDMDELVQTFRAAIKDTVGFTQAVRRTPEGDLGALLSFVAPNVAVTKTWTRRRGGRGDTTTGEADVVLNASSVRQPWKGREVTDWGVVFVEANAVREWCIQEQMAVSSFLNRVESIGMLARYEDGKDRAKLRLTTGCVGVPTAQGYYFMFRTRPAEAGEVSDGSNVVELRPAASVDAVEGVGETVAGS
jgi:hypothetical protein